jgi:SAM-dependent methyltransferase
LGYELEFIKKDKERFQRFQKLFRARYREEFLYGELTKWTYAKPYGYSGDFHIIDNIYNNKPATVGFDGLWDTYYLQMTACRATRMRKEKLKELIIETARCRNGRAVRIMDLASGPARGIKELLDADTQRIFSKTVFDCFDQDQHAIDYASQLIGKTPQVNFFQKNALRIALKKDVSQEIPYQYDLIYSAGLFDYLDERIAVRLVSNLYKLLKPGGMMVIANFGEKRNNSSAGLMEWVTEWYLIYRTENEFRRLFEQAGLLDSAFSVSLQDDEVVLYANVRK